MNEAQRAYIAKIQNETAQEEAANVSEVPDQSMLTGLVDSFTQGAAMGFGDEATGVVGANIRPAARVDNPETLTHYDPEHPYIYAEYDKSERG